MDTLGSATVICADKTGTRTENRMEVSTLVLPTGSFQVESGDDGAVTFRGDGEPASPPMTPASGTPSGWPSWPTR